MSDLMKTLVKELQEEWRAKAACSGMALTVEEGSDAFYPSKRDNVGRIPKDHVNKDPWAMTICDQCEVKVECLDYAMRKREKWGIWGGTTETQRRTLRSYRYRSHPEFVRDVLPVVNEVAVEISV